MEGEQAVPVGSKRASELGAKGGAPQPRAEIPRGAGEAGLADLPTPVPFQQLLVWVFP